MRGVLLLVPSLVFVVLSSLALVVQSPPAEMIRWCLLSAAAGGYWAATWFCERERLRAQAALRKAERSANKWFAMYVAKSFDRPDLEEEALKMGGGD